MNVLLLMIPMALALGLIFIFGFIWALKTGQLDDLQTPALRILNDDITKKNNPREDSSSWKK